MGCTAIVKSVTTRWQSNKIAKSNLLNSLGILKRRIEINKKEEAKEKDVIARKQVVKKGIVNAIKRGRIALQNVNA